LIIEGRYVPWFTIIEKTSDDLKIDDDYDEQLID